MQGTWKCKQQRRPPWHQIAAGGSCCSTSLHSQPRSKGGARCGGKVSKGQEGRQAGRAGQRKQQPANHPAKQEGSQSRQLRSPKLRCNGGKGRPLRRVCLPAPLHQLDVALQRAFRQHIRTRKQVGGRHRQPRAAKHLERGGKFKGRTRVSVVGEPFVQFGSHALTRCWSGQSLSMQDVHHFLVGPSFVHHFAHKLP